MLKIIPFPVLIQKECPVVGNFLIFVRLWENFGNGTVVLSLASFPIYCLSQMEINFTIENVKQKKVGLAALPAFCN